MPQPVVPDRHSDDPPPGRGGLLPFAALSASYFAHIGFFNPYLPLWLKDLGFGLFAISVLTSVQSATRLFAPYAWGTLSDRTGERVKLLRYGATAALVFSLALWFPLGPVALFVVLLLMFTHTSAMMPMSEAALAHLVSQGGAFDAKRYGRVRLWGSLGFLLTVMVAGWWFEHFGLGHFPAWTLLTLVAVVASVWWLPDHKEAAHHDDDHPAIWPLLLAAQALHAITFAAHHTVCIALISHHFPGRLRGRGQALYTVIGYGLPGVLGGLGGGVLSSALGLSAVFWLAGGLAGVATLCAMRLRQLDHRSG